MDSYIRHYYETMPNHCNFAFLKDIQMEGESSSHTGVLRPPHTTTACASPSMKTTKTIQAMSCFMYSEGFDFSYDFYLALNIQVNYHCSNEKLTCLKTNN